MNTKVLVVDDSATMRMIVTSVFTQILGWQAVSARDGQHAIDTATADRYDLIVTDINMPVMDGLRFVRALRQQPGYDATPVLVLTTDDDDAHKLEAADLGVYAWMHKPVDPDALAELAQELIEDPGA